MEPDIDIKMTNPWSCRSLYDFSYFCCPECETRWRDRQEFVTHAFNHHPQSMMHLQNIKDGSTEDIEFPNDIKVEEDEDDLPLSTRMKMKSGENLLKVLNNPGISIKPLPKDEQDEIKEELFENLDDLVDDLSDNDDLDEVVKDEDDDESETKEQENQECPKTNDATTDDIFSNKVTTTTGGSTKAGFTCDSCDFTTRNPRFLVAHVKNVHKRKKMHLNKEHKMTPKKPEPCLCGICGKTLIGRSNLKKHEREKHGIDNAKFIRKDKLVKIQCKKCTEMFETPLALNEHVIICTNESKKFDCISCDSKWANGHCLNIHLKVDHKMQEIHTCDTCGKCLKKKVSLASHIKVDHENIKDHVCHLCGRGFARQQGLQFHIKRVHENTGKHFCDRCTFKAITKPELEIHINEVHTKAIKFHCSDCNFFCYRKGGLAAHVKNVHLKLRPHRCDVCGQAFVRRKELEKHKEWANHGS